MILVLFLVALTALYWSGGFGLFQWTGRLTSTAGVLVLDDCDSDFKTPPFEDTVTLFAPDGKPVRKLSDLNICQTIGGCRSLSVSPDGRFYTVCENVSDKLTAWSLETGATLWSVNGRFSSAIVSPGGLVYALSNTGTISGTDTLVIDQKGQILRQAAAGGFDIALDPDSNVVWLVGKTVKLCDSQLKVLLEVSPITWCAVSVDVARDHSVWVAERQHPDVRGSTNRIINISAAGQVLKSVGLGFAPSCVRVDHSDGSVWVTGVTIQPSATKGILAAIEKRTGTLPTGKKLREFLTKPNVSYKTQRYDQNGVLQCELNRGGFSLDIDPNDGSLWIGGMERVYRYSRQGKLLGQSAAGAASQKYVAVIPGNPQPIRPPLK